MTLSSANQARKEEAEFHHKAVLTLAEMGWTTCAIADELDITQRRVQVLIKQPCGALEVERHEALKREAREQYARTKQRRAPFFIEEFIAARGILSADEMTWFGDWSDLTTEERVRRYMQDGKVSQVTMARLLSVDRRTVTRIIKAIRASVL